MYVLCPCGDEGLRTKTSSQFPICGNGNAFGNSLFPFGLFILSTCLQVIDVVHQPSKSRTVHIDNI